MSIQTNRLEIDFNINAIERDLAFIRFKRKSRDRWRGSPQLDRLIGDDYKANAVMFQYSDFAYAMFKRPVDTYKLLSTIRNDEDFSSDIVDEVLPRAFRTEADNCICEAWLAQILINSLASSRSRFEHFHYCNLTGDLIIVIDQKDKNYDFIDAAIVTLDKNYLLNVEIKRHRKLISIQKDIKAGKLDARKIKDKPSYILNEGTGTLRRLLPRDGKLDPKIIYIPLSYGNKRAHVNFIDFNSFKDYEQSRAGFLQRVLDSVQEHLSDYMSIKLRHLEISHTVELKETILKNPKQLHSKLDGQPIHIVDRIGSEESSDGVKTLKEALSPYVTDCKLITEGKRDKTGSFNFRIIHSADYYENNNEEDEHLASSANIYRQHITLETLESDEAILDAVIKTIIKEQLIKRDIGERNLSLFDWSKLNVSKTWTFATYVMKEKYIVFMDIFPDGHFEFRKIDPESHIWYGEKNQEYIELLTEAKNNKYKAHLSLEGLVISGEGDKNLIYHTEEISLPDLVKIKELIGEIDAKFPEGMRTGSVLASVVEQCFAETYWAEDEKVHLLKEDLSKMGYQELSKRDFKKILNSCLGKTSRAAKHLRNALYDKHGVRLHFPKDKDNMSTLFEASLNIKYFGENESEAYYFVGERRENVKFSFKNACHLRKIKAVNGSRLVFKELLPTMDVDFVRTGQSTVLPFPFKYIREYAKFED